MRIISTYVLLVTVVIATLIKFSDAETDLYDGRLKILSVYDSLSLSLCKY